MDEIPVIRPGDTVRLQCHDDSTIIEIESAIWSIKLYDGCSPDSVEVRLDCRSPRAISHQQEHRVALLDDNESITPEQRERFWKEAQKIL